MSIKIDDGTSLPTAIHSEAEMAKDAPAAVELLKRSNNLDLVEALGLTNYLKE